MSSTNVISFNLPPSGVLPPEIREINGKNQWFPQDCKSQWSHMLKTANIRSCYDPRSRLWYYKAYNRAFCGPTTHKSSYKRASKKGNVSLGPISTLTNLQCCASYFNKCTAVAVKTRSLKNDGCEINSEGRGDGSKKMAEKSLKTDRIWSQ
jgi:hypothetical protein